MQSFYLDLDRLPKLSRNDTSVKTWYYAKWRNFVRRQ